jgi:hypothetical protein
MTEQANKLDEIDAEFSPEIQVLLRECAEAERAEAAALNTPENDAFVRRILDECAAAERLRFETENTPEVIAENQRIFDYLIALTDDGGDAEFTS